MKFSWLMRLALVILAGCVPVSSGAADPPAESAVATTGPVIATRAGRVRGIDHGATLSFLGLPYASPPTGSLRWAPPQAVRPWRGVRDATRYANYCAQSKALLDFAERGTDEDCLYLNIFAPKAKGKHPVMMWIHGGGFYTGMSNGYDGRALAEEQGVVVVTINYRLGAFGLLVHPAFDQGGAATNYALRDQQFVLQWIRDNIARFGGDPANVTLFGESTGGVSITLHMTSPTAQGLFHKAIIQSGTTRYRKRMVPLAEAEAQGRAFAAALGCPDQSAQCLRAVPVETILKKFDSDGSALQALPVEDGHVTTSAIGTAIDSGHFHRIPILNVTNRNEGNWFVALMEAMTGKIIETDDYTGELRQSWGAHADAVAAAYPISPDGSAAAAYAAASGDDSSSCQARQFDLAAARHAPVYAAEFDDPASPGILPPASIPLLSSHSHEIQYIFPGWKGVSKASLPPLTAAQSELARRMRAAWGHFAATGVPGPDWVAVRDISMPVMMLRPSGLANSADFSRVHHCDFWEHIRAAPAG